VLDPLDHLLARHDELVALAELLLQAIERQVIVVAAEEDMDREAQAELTLQDQARPQGRNRHARLAARTRVFRAHEAPPQEGHRDEIDLLGDLFADPLQRPAAAHARRRGRLDRDRLRLEGDRQPVRRAVAALARAVPVAAPLLGLTSWPRARRGGHHGRAARSPPAACAPD
jgi:hypothetical protein